MCKLIQHSCECRQTSGRAPLTIAEICLTRGDMSVFLKPFSGCMIGLLMTYVAKQESTQTGAIIHCVTWCLWFSLATQSPNLNLDFGIKFSLVVNWTKKVYSWNTLQKSWDIANVPNQPNPTFSFVCSAIASLQSSLPLSSHIGFTLKLTPIVNLERTNYLMFHVFPPWEDTREFRDSNRYFCPCDGFLHPEELKDQSKCLEKYNGQEGPDSKDLEMLNCKILKVNLNKNTFTFSVKFSILCRAIIRNISDHEVNSVHIGASDTTPLW